MSDRTPPQPPTRGQPQSLRSLVPFLRPYKGRIALAGIFLVMAAVTTLVLPLAMRGLIDQGFLPSDPGDRIMAVREHFLALFGVGGDAFT